MTERKLYIITDDSIQKIRDYLTDEQDSDEMRFAAFDALNGVLPYLNQREMLLNEMLAALQNEGMAAWDERGYIKFIESFRQKETKELCMRGLEKCSKDCDGCPDAYTCSESSK
jgi:hypothetical protein